MSAALVKLVVNSAISLGSGYIAKAAISQIVSRVDVVPNVITRTSVYLTTTAAGIALGNALNKSVNEVIDETAANIKTIKTAVKAAKDPAEAPKETYPIHPSDQN